MQRKDTVVEGDVLRGLNKEELRLLGLFFGLRECGGCAWHSKRNNQKDRPHDMHRCLLRSSFTPILAATVEALSSISRAPYSLQRPFRPPPNALLLLPELLGIEGAWY